MKSGAPLKWRTSNNNNKTFNLRESIPKMFCRGNVYNCCLLVVGCITRKGQRVRRYTSDLLPGVTPNSGKLQAGSSAVVVLNQLKCRSKLVGFKRVDKKPFKQNIYGILINVVGLTYAN